MAQRVCTWWFAYSFDNPLRRLLHNPQTLLAGHVKEGMTVLDAGCGMGHFSLGMAQLVGGTGRVIAVDVQPQMLKVLTGRARKAKLSDRIVTHLANKDNMGVETPIDFALAFWMVHETPHAESFFSQIRSILKPQGRLLIAEPLGHVPLADFNRTVTLAQTKGFRLLDRPAILLSRGALFESV